MKGRWKTRGCQTEAVAFRSFTGSHTKFGLDFLDDTGIFRVGQEGFLRVHLKYAVPLELILIFGDKMEVHMPAGITERAVIDLIGMEDCMDGLSDTADVSEEGIAFVIG